MNNSGIYDAVISGVGGTIQSTPSTNPALAAFADRADILATAIDSLIPIIPDGASTSQMTLMGEVVSGLMANRFLGDFSGGSHPDYTGMAVEIVRAYNELAASLQNVPVASIVTIYLGQAVWYISKNGDNSASGTTPATAITPIELQRRIGRQNGAITQDVTIYCTDDPSQIILDLVTVSGVTITITQTGWTVVEAVLQFTSTTNISNPNNTFYTGIIAALDWTPYAPCRLRITSGASIGNVFWIGRVAPLGAGGAATPAGTVQVTPSTPLPAAANSWTGTQVSPSNSYTFTVEECLPIGELDIRITNTPQTPASIAGNVTSSPQLVLASVNVTKLSVDITGSMANSLTIWGSQIGQYASASAWSGNAYVTGCQLILTDAVLPSAVYRGCTIRSSFATVIAKDAVELNYSSIEGTSLRLLGAGQNVISNCCIATSPVGTPGLSIGPWVSVRTVSLVGQANGTYGLSIDTNGIMRCAISAGAASNVKITGASGAWIFEGEATARLWSANLPMLNSGGVVTGTLGTAGTGLARFDLPNFDITSNIVPGYKSRAVGITAPLDVPVIDAAGFTVRGDIGTDITSTINAHWQRNGGLGGVVAG